MSTSISQIMRISVNILVLVWTIR